MGHEDVKSLLDQHPFVPLRVHLSTGDTREINAREAALLTRNWLAFGEMPRMGWWRTRFVLS